MRDTGIETLRIGMRRCEGHPAGKQCEWLTNSPDGYCEDCGDRDCICGVTFRECALQMIKTFGEL